MRSLKWVGRPFYAVACVLAAIKIANSAILTGSSLGQAAMLLSVGCYLIGAVIVLVKGVE